MTFVPNLRDGVESLESVPTLCSMNNMNNTTNTITEYVAIIEVQISSSYRMAHHLPIIAGSVAQATEVAEGRTTDATVGYGGQFATVLDVLPLDEYNERWSQHINHRDIPYGAIVEED